MKPEKNRLFKNTNIRVYWKDQITHKIMSGILLDKELVTNEIPVDSQGFTGPTLETNYYVWSIRGDDGLFYSIEEKHLQTSSINFLN